MIEEYLGERLESTIVAAKLMGYKVTIKGRGIMFHGNYKKKITIAINHKGLLDVVGRSYKGEKLGNRLDIGVEKALEFVADLL